MTLNSNQKILFVGGGLVILVVIGVVLFLVFRQKKETEHSTAAMDAAKMAVMHANVAKTAATSPDNSQKSALVKHSVDAAQQSLKVAQIHADASNDNAAHAAVNSAEIEVKSVPVVSQPTAPITPAPTSPILNPTQSGEYLVYSPKYDLYLPNFKSTTSTTLQDKTDAGVFYWDSTSNQLLNGDKSTLTIEGATNISAIPSTNGVLLKATEGWWSGFFPVGPITGQTGYQLTGAMSSGSAADADYVFAFVPV
jgi:hypothetical protein